MNKQKKGRPARYQTPEEMQIKIDEYFKDCEGDLLRDSRGNVVLDKQSRPVYVGRRVPSVSGLSHYLGFTDRHTFTRYKRKPEFVDTVLLARLRIEEKIEEMLFFAESASGAKFALVSNFGWQYRVKPPMLPPTVQFINKKNRGC